MGIVYGHFKFFMIFLLLTWFIAMIPLYSDIVHYICHTDRWYEIYTKIKVLLDRILDRHAKILNNILLCISYYKIYENNTHDKISRSC